MFAYVVNSFMVARSSGKRLIMEGRANSCPNDSIVNMARKYFKPTIDIGAFILAIVNK